MSGFYEFSDGSVPIKFPYEPYGVQKAYINKVLTCLNERKFGLLESPTGTGKTLSLLCASLAWLENERSINRPVAIGGMGNSFPSGPDADIKALLSGSSAASLQGSTWTGGAPGFSKCRIIYASRTHSQLAQVIGEFQRSPYQNVPSVILASREQLCINDSVTSAVNSDRNQMCRLKVKTKTCEFYNNIERQADLDLGGACGSSINGDIESLRKNGQKRKVCPYYASRELSTRADIIFLPYNYLVDPRIRKTLSVDLAESIVIIDEAHNVLRIFEDSSSISFTTKEVAIALAEIDFLLSVMENADLAAGISLLPELDTTQVYILKDCLSKFESNLLEFEKKCPMPKSDNDNPIDFSGDVVVDIFNSSGINGGNAATVCLLIGQSLDSLSTVASSGGPQKGKGLTKLSEVIDLLFMNHSPVPGGGSADFTREKMKQFYRFHVARKLEQGKVTTNTEFHLWCFHPGFSLQSLVRCNIRTLILTSGTLKPLDSFQKELAADFPIMLQNDHVIDPTKQIAYQVISRGPDNTELIATFQSRQNPKYLSSLGLAIIEIAKRVPDGLLVFFPSYAWMESCVNHWQSHGQWERLVQIKPCYVETKEKMVLNRNVNEFRLKVSMPGSIGACFMAVCRGKLSEGIDFSDRDARAVIITGIPFPSVRDPKVQLKKKFLDNMKFSQKQDMTLSGAEWYNLEAFRAVNQAIGRVIRHKNDFGAVILLDKRFAQEGCAAKLPSWLSKSTHETVFRTAMQKLDEFFNRNKSAYAPIARLQYHRPADTLGLAPSKGEPIKRSVSEKSKVNDEPAPKKKKIVIKSRTREGGDDISSSDNSSKETDQKTLELMKFVSSLKEKLVKADLKLLLQSVRSYRDDCDSSLFFNVLKSYLKNELLTKEETLRFRSFVRPQDEKDYDKIFEL